MKARHVIAFLIVLAVPVLLWLVPGRFDFQPIEGISRLFKYKAMVKQQNVPIRFWGVILDQDDHPIPDVHVTMAVRQWKVGPLGGAGAASLTHAMETDRQGRFGLTNELGDALELNVEKRGYRPSPQMRRSFSYYGPAPHLPDPEKPVLMHMWRETNSEPTLVQKGFFRLIADGRFYTIDVITNERHEGSYSRGHILLSLKRPEKIGGPKDRYPWTVEIGAISGGLIEADDEFLFAAPETGYVEKVTISIDPASSDWNHILKKNFYFRADVGIYAAIRMEIYSYYASNPAVKIVSVLNTNNSRNLQR